MGVEGEVKGGDDVGGGRSGVASVLGVDSVTGEDEDAAVAPLDVGSSERSTRSPVSPSLSSS